MEEEKLEGEERNLESAEHLRTKRRTKTSGPISYLHVCTLHLHITYMCVRYLCMYSIRPKTLGAFLDALASLKTILDINSFIDVFKISRLQSIREYCRRSFFSKDSVLSSCFFNPSCLACVRGVLCVIFVFLIIVIVRYEMSYV